MRFLRAFLKNLLSVAVALLVAYGFLGLLVLCPILAMAIFIAAFVALLTYLDPEDFR